MHYRDPKYIVPSIHMRGPETEVQYFERMVREHKIMKKAQARQQLRDSVINWLENAGRQLRFEVSPFFSKHA